MKTKIFKVLSVVLALMVVLSTCILVASAASATITFDDTAKRTIGTTSQQVWVENGITVTNDKGSSTSNVNTKYYNPVRFYKSSDVTIEYPGMTQIVIACNSSDYATACKNSITSGTVTSSGKNVTIVLAEAIDSYKFVCSGGQIRVDSITVYTGDTAPEEPEVPENNDPAADSTLTIVEAIALGTSKEHNVYTDGKYYVTGEITEVYNAQYGNMYIKDAEGNQLTIYGTYSADGKTGYSSMETKPVAGDTVKIYGIIGQYNGTAQIKNGWIVEHTPSETPVEPEEPEVQDPAADSTLTIAEAIALGASKAHNEYTAGKYYVAGEITEVYNEQYGNMKIKDAEGNILTIYGTYSADGSDRYDAMETKPVAGDTVKIYGIVGQYNGTPQIKNGWIVEHTPATQPEEPVVPPVEPEEPTPEEPTPEEPTGNTATYVFADYKVEGELGGGEVIRELDSTVTFTISTGWLTTEARIYKNANAVIASKKAISSIVLNAGYKDSTFNVYTSTDGVEWTTYQTGVAYTTAYADVTVEFEIPVKYIKLDAPNAQLRAKTLTVNFVSEPEEPTVCTHAYDDEFDVFCNNCNEMREINYPADKVELKEIDGVKYIYVNGITSVEGLFKVGNDYYCATWGGVVLTGDQYVHFSYCDKAAGRHFYFSEDGKMLDKGFVTGKDGIKRLYVDSRTSVEGMFEVDGKYYLATWGGVVLTDGRYYVTESFAAGLEAGKNFTVNAEGEILDGIVEIDGQKYLYDFGTTVVPGDYDINGTIYTATWGGLIVE